MSTVVRVACPHDCPDTCAMLVTVNEAGRAIKVESDPNHPATDGVLPPASRRLPNVHPTYSTGVGMDMDQYSHSRLIVIWGSNPITTSVHFWRRVQEAQRNGAILIAIDPHRSLAAQKCNQHIAVLPGTDAALALGLIHLFVRDGWLDHDYIDNYTVGFEQLAERAASYTPERVAGICGIPVATIEDLAS